jgi:hypothetical protein
MSVPSASGASSRRLHRIARLLAVLLCLGLPAVLVSRPAYAASLVVNTATDAPSDGACDPTPAGCSIRDALAVAGGAAGPDTITFDPVVTSISLTQGTLDIPADVTITGAANRTTLTAAVAGRIVNVIAGPVTLENLNLNGNFVGSGVSNAALGTLTGLTISNSRISNTTGAPQGGAILNSGFLTVNDAAFDVNSAADGGTIFNTGTLALNGSSIQFASATNTGGIYNLGGTITATRCYISGSSASGPGGGFRNSGGDASFTNCTFSNSSTDTGGGAGMAVDAGTVTLTNVTVASNSVRPNVAGAGILQTGGTVTLRNSLIANNRRATLTTNTLNDLEGTFVSDGYNLVRSPGGATINNISATDVIGSDPLITAAAASHGAGNNLLTHALLPGSPAIDGAVCPGGVTTDQRGVARGTTGTTPCDIGAFESRGFTLNVTGGSGQSTLVNTPFSTPVTLLLAPVSADEPFGSGRLTFTGPSSGAGTIPATGNVTASSDGNVEINFLNANGVAGSYNLQVGGKGITTPALVSLSNTTNAVAGFSSTPAPGSTINFGLATVGTSINRGISVSESGTDTLVVSNVAVSGPNAAEFSVAPTAFSIADGDPATNVTVTCTPSAPGIRTATLTITHNAGAAATYALNCEGTLTPLPSYSSNPAPNGTLNIGTGPVGVAMNAALNITNNGAAPLTISSVVVSGSAAGEFSVTPSTLTVGAGATQPLNVSCTPAFTGTRTATLTVNHNAGEAASYTLTCSSNGIFLPLVGK